MTVGSLGGSARVTGGAVGLTVDAAGGTVSGSAPLFGARVAPFTVAPYNTVSGVEAEIGQLLVGRVFHNSGLPSNYSSTLADSGMSGTATGTGCIISTQTTGNYSSYVQSIPSALLDAGLIWMTWHHEPEGDYAAGSDFVSEYTTFYNAIKAIDSRVKVGPIAEGDKYGRYPLADATAGNYLPDPSVCDFYGVDLYHPMNASPNSTLDPETVTTLASFADWQGWYTNLVKGRGRPVIIAEWGMYAEPDQYNTGAPNTTDEAIKQANRATMIGNWFGELSAVPEGVQAVSYWYVDGKSTEHGTFRPSDVASNQALAAIPRG